MEKENHESRSRIQRGHAVQIRTRVSEDELKELEAYADEKCLSLAAVTRIIFMEGLKVYRGEMNNAPSN